MPSRSARMAIPWSPMGPELSLIHIFNEVTLVGSRCGRFEAAIPLLDHALIQTQDMIAARFPLRDAAQAFERAAQRGVLKVLLEA